MAALEASVTTELSRGYHKTWELAGPSRPSCCSGDARDESRRQQIVLALEETASSGFSFSDSSSGMPASNAGSMSCIDKKIGRQMSPLSSWLYGARGPDAASLLGL